MPTMKREEIEDIIRNSIFDLSWLMVHNLKVDVIANFGCDIGVETLALMWSFGAEEAVGVDINPADIDTAQMGIDQIKGYLEECRRAANLVITDINDRQWWLFCVPNSIKRGMLPTYINADMRMHTGLEDNYYDLAYCASVLYHLNIGDGLTKAISEMHRVVKVGGYIVVDEPIKINHVFVPESVEKIFDEDRLQIFQKVSG